MDIIPVIDVMGGVVVHARRGERSHYAPIDSPLCRSSAPLTVARILSETCASLGSTPGRPKLTRPPRGAGGAQPGPGGAHTLYLADLDALQGRPAQTELVAALLTDAPQRQLWVDAGFADGPAAHAWLQRLGPLAARVRPVFASESLRDRPAALSIRAVPGLLSLDRRGPDPWDAAGCWDDPSLWPDTVIMMTLERVGADLGPDLDTLRALRQRSPATRFIGAGGLRDVDDLARAAAAGASAWLVASALHDGRLHPPG